MARTKKVARKAAPVDSASNSTPSLETLDISLLEKSTIYAKMICIYVLGKGNSNIPRIFHALTIFDNSDIDENQKFIVFAQIEMAFMQIYLLFRLPAQTTTAPQAKKAFIDLLSCIFSSCCKRLNRSVPVEYSIAFLCGALEKQDVLNQVGLELDISKLAVPTPGIPYEKLLSESSNYSAHKGKPRFYFDPATDLSEGGMRFSSSPQIPSKFEAVYQLITESLAEIENKDDIPLLDITSDDEQDHISTGLTDISVDSDNDDCSTDSEPNADPDETPEDTSIIPLVQPVIEKRTPPEALTDADEQLPDESLFAADTTVLSCGIISETDAATSQKDTDSAIPHQSNDVDAVLKSSVEPFNISTVESTTCNQTNTVEAVPETPAQPSNILAADSTAPNDSNIADTVSKTSARTVNFSLPATNFFALPADTVENAKDLLLRASSRFNDSVPQLLVDKPAPRTIPISPIPLTGKRRDFKTAFSMSTKRQYPYAVEPPATKKKKVFTVQHLTDTEFEKAVSVLLRRVKEPLFTVSSISCVRDDSTKLLNIICGVIHILEQLLLRLPTEQEKIKSVFNTWFSLKGKYLDIVSKVGLLIHYLDRVNKIVNKHTDANVYSHVTSEMSFWLQFYNDESFGIIEEIASLLSWITATQFTQKKDISFQWTFAKPDPLSSLSDFHEILCGLKDTVKVTVSLSSRPKNESELFNAVQCAVRDYFQAISDGL
ncbi:MAG: hypothetical protein AAF364_17180 [Pseudomonadota bacterium]